MFCQFIHYPSFRNYFNFENDEGGKSSSHSYCKIALMTGVALASLGLATWQAVQQNRLAAIALSVGGICIEIALMILWPSRPPVVQPEPGIQPIEDLPVKDQPGKDLPEKDLAVKDQPGKNQPGKELPAKDLAVKDQPGKDLPAKDLTGKDQPVKDLTGKDQPAKDLAIKDLPVKDLAVKDQPIEDHLEPKDALTSVIDHLEACYPVKAIDPVQIQDKQAGGMMGQACGDAIGLFTEFTTKKEAQKMIRNQPIELGSDYPEGFKDGYNWNHIKRFIKNGWTDDTDQALSLLRALYCSMKIEKDPQVSFEVLFARELKKWRNHGLRSEDPFVGRSNPYCMGLGALVSKVLQQPIFIKTPQKAAENVWAEKPEEPLQFRPAANGAIMRTAPIGLIFYRSLKDVVTYTIEACKVTHVDPRCTASCVALTLAIALSLRGYDVKDIFNAAEEGGLTVLRQELNLAAEKGLLSKDESQDLDPVYEACAEEFKAHLHGNWETLDLDEGYKMKNQINKIGYTFKCMGAAFYALSLADQYQKDKKPDVFRLIIEEIAAEGGDADTNGAAAGALLGAYLGFKGQFPSNWTTQLADAPVLDQAIQHVEELTLKHEQNQAMLAMWKGQCVSAE